jgi:hypothetical protein
MFFIELAEEAEVAAFPGNVLEFNLALFLCTIFPADDGIFVGKISTCFDWDRIEGHLTSLGHISVCLEESGPFCANTLEGFDVDEIFLGNVSVHLDEDTTFLVKAAVCFGSNGCTADFWNCSTVGCTGTRPWACGCSLGLDASGMHVFELKRNCLLC